MDLKKIISQGESETVEFKKSLSESKEIIKAISAFANTKGGKPPYKRVGKSTLRMNKDEYERSILEKHKDKLYFDSQICKEATLGDIDKEKIRWFLKEGKRQGRVNVSIDASIDEILMKLRLLKNSKLTNSAILLFGKNVEQFFIQSEIKCILLSTSMFAKPYASYQTYDKRNKRTYLKEDYKKSR